MILVDTSVWIDFFRDKSTLHVDRLISLLQTRHLGMADLVLTEILQGCGSDREFDQVKRFVAVLPVVATTSEAIAIEAARNYRTLRTNGITVRKTIDTLIATRCIVDGHALLYSDRDFDPFVEHLGLVSGMEV
jgi:predicted nucleic acid-binding protein